jgi:hypothetical protein
VIGVLLAGAGGVARIGGEIVIHLAEVDGLNFVTPAELQIEGGTHLVGFDGK